MDKEFLKNVALVLSFIMLAVNFFGIHQLKNEVENLKRDNIRIESNLQTGIWNLDSRMWENQEAIKAELKKAQSLFSEISVDLALQGDRIAVSIYALPKDLEAGERILAQIEVDGQTYEQELGTDNRAEILVEKAEWIKPVLVLKSDSGERREVLEEQSTRALLAVNISHEWMVESFCLVMEEGQQPFPFVKEDIETAEFIIADSGIVRTQPNSGYGQMQESIHETTEAEVAEFFRTLQGDKIPALEMNHLGSLGIAYRVDLSEYIARKDGVYYEIYFSMTTRDGVRYVSEKPVATFSFLEGGRSTGSGEDTLRPLFPQEKS